MAGLARKFRRKKEKAPAESEKTMTELERFCGNDKETYEALFNTMALDPRKIGSSMKEAAENAKKAEKEKDLVKARVWYRIAGSLAIYEGNPKKAAEFFSECQRLSPSEKFTILKNPEKAVAKAQEYYKENLTS
jgi:hypothetical protein